MQNLIQSLSSELIQTQLMLRESESPHGIVGGSTQSTQ